MRCESCNRSFKRDKLLSTEAGLICQKCMDKSLGIHKCDVCNTKMTDKFGFCLVCGRINHDYKPADYVRSEDL